MDRALKERIIEHARNNPIFKFCNLEVVSLDDGEAVGRMYASTEHLNHVDAVHGGILYTLSDTFAGMAAFTTGKYCVTLNANYEYYKMAKAGILTCRNRIIHAGRKIIRVNSQVFNSEDELLCEGIMTYYILGDL